MKKHFLKFFSSLLIGIIILSSTHVFASSASIDTSFGTKIPVGFNGVVQALAVQSDGKIVAAGSFTTYE